MTESNRTIQAFWVALGALSSLGLSIVSAAILSRYFDKVEYGTYRQILYVYNSLLVFFTAGLPSVFSYFLPRYSLAEGKSIVWKVGNLLFMLGLGFSLVLFISAPLAARLLNNPELESGLRLFAPIPMLILPTLGLEGIFATYQKTIYITIYNTLTRLLMLVCIVVPVIYWGNRWENAIYGWIVASVFSLLLALYFRRIPFGQEAAVSTKLSVREILGFSLPLVTASIWGMAMRSADQFYISRYFGPEVYAEFSNGFIEIPFVGMITGAATTVLTPVFSRLLVESDGKEEMVRIWRSTLVKSATLIYPMVVFFLFNAKLIMSILFSKSYEASGVYFQINMLLNFFNIIIFIPLLFALGKTSFYSNMHLVFAIVAWVGGFLMIKIFFSPIANALFSILCNIAIVFVALFFTIKILRLRFLSLIPLKQFFLITAHASVVALILKLVFINFQQVFTPMIELIVFVVIYPILLLLSAKIAGIQYLDGIKPVLARFPVLQKLANRAH